MNVVEEIVEETRATLPEDATQATWTLGDMLRLGAVGVTQEFGGFGQDRQVCAQSAIGLGYRALFG